MRLSLTTLLVSTLATFPLLSHVSAIHPQVLSRREHPSSSLILSSRQHRVPRSILDLCINANVDLLADASHLLGLAPILGPLDLGSNIQLCLCLKDLDIFLDTNVDIKALVGLLGKNTVSALITALINTSPDASQCSFPPHAHHTCNNHDPCHYECEPHYVRVGDTCVCAPPYTSCNGDCDIFLKGCGSAVPRSFKARDGPITTITQAKATCKPHQTVCGIPERRDTLDFECIDVDNADDSCGGCMAPHPFPEAGSGLHVSGMDCTRISNAKNSKCVGQRCIISKCKLGWVPNPARDTCILDPPKVRKVLKREDSLITNVTANTHVGSDLVAKIGDIVKSVSGLNCPPSQIPASSSSSTAVVSDLLDGIADATSTLIASTTVPSLLNNLDALLTVTSRLSSTISSCGCGTDLGLTGLEDALGNIVAALLDLKNWCAYNVSTGLNLSGLLSGLGLNSSTGAVVNSDLVDQIKSLVGLVVGLAGVSSSLPPPSPGSSSIPTSSSDSSSINTNIINSIINATAFIVNSPTVPSLVSSIGTLANANGLASSLLDHCGCVSALGLGPLVVSLAQVANATLRMQDWCDTHPVAGIPQVPATGNSSTVASTSISNTDELSIDLGLSNLLGLLRPVESNVNGILGGLEDGLLISTDDAPPVSAATSAVGDILNPKLVTQLEDLVNLVTELQSSYTPSGPASLNASTLLDPNLVEDVVQKTANIFGSPTAISLVANVDALVTANSALQTALTNCACVDILGLDDMVNHLVLVTDAALGLRNWCSSNSTITLHRVVSRSSPPPPLDALLSATKRGLSSSILPVAPSGQGTSDSSIVIDLDYLLSGLGLPVRATVAVDGLGNGLNGLGSGFIDVRRRIIVGRHITDLQTLDVKGRRQITADTDTSVASELLTKIGGLVGIVLRLVGVALPAPASAPSGLSNNVYSSVVDNVFQATRALLSASSMGAIESEVNGVVAASLASVKTLDSCGCVDNSAIYDSLVQVAEASLDLQDWCHGHSMLMSPPHSSSIVNSSTSNIINELTIVGLTKLLNGFGPLIGLNSDASPINSVLDDFGIPNGLRRRVTREI